MANDHKDQKDLSDTYIGTSFAGQDLSGYILNGTFIGCDFSGANLDGAKLNGDFIATALPNGKSSNDCDD